MTGTISVFSQSTICKNLMPKSDTFLYLIVRRLVGDLGIFLWKE